MTRARVSVAVVAASAAVLFAPACKETPPVMPASTPVSAPAPARPAPPIDLRVAWLLRLEQSRTLRDSTLGPREPMFAAGSTRALVAAPDADLLALSIDTDPGVRRRALLAIGRVGTTEGVPAVLAGLTDESADVRAMAAFAAGLIGAPASAPPLEKALADQSALVRGRAAEALGLVGQASSAAAIAQAFSGCRETIASIDPDDESSGKSAEVDACRLAILATVRLKSYDALAKLTLDDGGQPASRWWPVAFAFQRVADRRGIEPLVTLAASAGIYTPSFAMRGLATLKDARVVPIAQGFATRAAGDIRVRVTAVRALGQIGGTASVDTLLALVRDRATPQNLALEAVTALGRAHDPKAFDTVLDLTSDKWPTMRAAVVDATAAIDPDRFLFVVPSLSTDRDWSVRAAVAGALANLPPDRVRLALVDMTADPDVRVRIPALTSLAKVGSPDLTAKLFEALDAPDFVLRATAARLVGQTKPDGGVPKLVAAYARGQSDATYVARVATLEALRRYAGPEAIAALHQGLNDKEWPVRARSAELLHELGEAAAEPVRPAPLREPAEYFQSALLLHPQYSPHALIETRRGTIEIEFDVVNAPLTTARIIEMARSGFFNGMKIHRVVPDFVVQLGDPRGDGEGGPGYSMPDEISPAPYVRGTVGMALDFKDTGGSQFFVTLSPQPHLDAKYTVFGHVVNGMEFLDQIAQWDVIERIRIWDGVTLK
jgi:cyclophilin family peptidyl-prolyl cis-trans isomerase/HEAT repeat protein